MNSVHDLLDELRASVGVCRLIAYVDLGAELVLSCSAEVKPPQEKLDALASMASRALGAPGSPADRAAPGGAAADEAVILSPDGSTLILRSQNDQTEALCCVCARGQDMELLRTAARDNLERIAAAG